MCMDKVLLVSYWLVSLVLYCWCHSDSASVLLYFTCVSWPRPPKDESRYRSKNSPSFDKVLLQLWNLQKQIKYLIIDKVTCWRSVLMIYVFKFRLIIIFPISPSPRGFTCFTMTVCLWKSGFCTITPFHFDLKWWCFIYTWVGHDPTRTVIDLWGPKVKSNSDYKLFTVSAPYFHPLLACYFTHVLTMTRGWPLLILVSMGHRSWLDFVFEVCTVSAP